MSFAPSGFIHGWRRHGTIHLRWVRIAVASESLSDAQIVQQFAVAARESFAKACKNVLVWLNTANWKQL